MIERYSHWNEDIGEWQLKCVAYTGNNMRKQLALNSQTTSREVRIAVGHLFCIFLSLQKQTSLTKQTWIRPIGQSYWYSFTLRNTVAN